MENLILQRRKMVQDRIEKSFSSGLHNASSGKTRNY